MPNATIAIKGRGGNRMTRRYRFSGLGMQRRGMFVRSVAALASAMALSSAPSASAALFWTNSYGKYNGFIGAANLGKHSAKNVKQRLIHGIGEVYGIAAGPGNTIYWAGTTNDHIGRARMRYDKHGKLRITVTRNFIAVLDSTGSPAHPVSVAVSGGYIYWGNLETGSIGRAKLDASQVNQSFVQTQNNSGGLLNAPCGIAVTPSYIYWGDSAHGRINRASTATGTSTAPLITGLHSPCGVTVNGSHIYWAAAHGLPFDSDVNVASGGGSIARANLDGTGVNERFIPGTRNPCMLAISGRYIYWSNQGAGGNGTTIGRAQLNGTRATEHYLTGASRPCGVAVNGFKLKTNQNTG